MERGKGLMFSVLFGLDGVKRLLLTMDDNFGAKSVATLHHNRLGI
jgi:hypothetical protein